MSGSFPGYGDAVRLLWQTSRPLTFAVAIYAIASAVLPNVVLIAAGHLVGDIPAAARGGLSSPAGHHMIAALAVTGSGCALRTSAAAGLPALFIDNSLLSAASCQQAHRRWWIRQAA